MWGWVGGCFKGEKIENEVLITCSATVIAQIVGGKPLSFMFFTCPTSIALNGITGLLVSMPQILATVSLDSITFLDRLLIP